MTDAQTLAVVSAARPDGVLTGPGKSGRAHYGPRLDKEMPCPPRVPT